MSSIPLAALHAEAPQQSDPSAAIARIMQMKSLMQGQQLQQQQIQGAQIENQERQFALQQQQAGIRAMQQWDGKNYDELPDLMAKNGASLQTVMQAKAGIVKYKQDLASLDKDQLANEKTKNDFLAGLLDQVKSLPPDQQPQGFENAKAQAIQRGYLDPQQAQQFAYQGPQQLDMMEKSLMGHSALVEQTLKEAQTGEAKARAESAQASAEKTQSEVDAMKQFGGLSPEFLRSKYIALTAKQSQGIPISPADKAFLKSYEGEKKIVPQFNFNLQQGALTPEAQQMAAQNYQQTGQLPAGMRSPAMSAGILNKAAATNPTVNIAANKASYQADAESLRNLQKMRDSVVAFENTAGKNLDLFINQAQKVVDSGSPWANRPLRKISSGALGSADLAAYNAARQVAINEIAKVTSNPGMSGQLSDAARHEVEGFNPADATLKQTLSVARVLKQDMENRRISYDEQLQQIKGRMNQGQSQPTQGGNDPFAQFGGKALN